MHSKVSPQRIAVVGSGVSGLVAAHVLSRRHDVHLFEAAPRPGGHTNTVEIELAGRTVAVDTGFIVHNRRTYPRFVRLLESLGIESDETDMSFSVASEASGLEWCSRNLDTVFAQRRNLLRPSFHRMLRDLLRMNRALRAVLARPDDGRTLGELLEAGGFGPELARDYVLPMAGAIWSAEPAAMGAYPLRAFAAFFENHGLLQVSDHPRWRTIRGGARRYVEALLRPLRERLRLDTPVRAIRRHGEHVTVASDAMGNERFDHVVLAVHSDQALALLTDPTAAEKDVLGAIPYQENEAVLHTDARLLPRSRRAWASWNAFLPARPSGRVSVTYWMNALQRLDVPETVCVTLNRSAEIDPARILYRTTYHHPLFTRDGLAAQARHAEVSGVARTHYCGAWWGHGFHEDGVRSALAVCEAFGEEP